MWYYLQIWAINTTISVTLKLKKVMSYFRKMLRHVLMASFANVTFLIHRQNYSKQYSNFKMGHCYRTIEQDMLESLNYRSSRKTI